MQFSTFSFAQQHNVRAFEQNGIAWFVAADICAALEIQNATQAVSRLDDDERSEIELTDAMGRNQKANIINESGLYILILRSRQAMTKGTTAWKFRKWVTAEVLPAIRKTGSYTQGSLKISPAQKQQIQAAVMARHHRTGEHWQEIYRKLHAYCRVNSYHEIPADRFQTAIAYLDSIENAPAYRQPLLDGLDIERLAVTVYYGAWALEMLNEVALPLRQLGHPKATTMHTLWAESRGFLRHNVQALRRILPALEPDRAAHVRGSLDRLQRLNARFI